MGPRRPGEAGGRLEEERALPGEDWGELCVLCVGDAEAVARFFVEERGVGAFCADRLLGARGGLLLVDVGFGAAFLRAERSTAAGTLLGLTMVCREWKGAP